MTSCVILFDIDGTLISSQSAEAEERQRYVSAIRDLTGKDISATPSQFAGMVDPQICRILLSQIGLTERELEDLLPKVFARMGEIYRTIKKQPILNDGVDKLLPILSKSRTHILGVVTGNLSKVGEEKLTVAGIKPYFSAMFYADEYVDRNRLVKEAVDACLAKYQLIDRKNVIIVGDTPTDIKAANATNASSIGIATGPFSIRQLCDAGANHVFPDLKPTRRLLRALAFESA